MTATKSTSGTATETPTKTVPNKIVADSLAALPGIRHGFYTRQGGTSDGLYRSLNGGYGSNDEATHVAANRARIAHDLGAGTDDICTVHQIHSPSAVLATGLWSRDKTPKADALVTDRPGLPIAILTADCGPILFAEPEAGVIGAAHAGWKGALHGVLDYTIAAMEDLGASRGAIIAVLGPTISGAAYEVGPEFKPRFTEIEPDYDAFFTPSERDGHFMFDLPAFIIMRLKQAGLRHVVDLGLCTYGDEERFFSYRRSTHRNEPDYGRLVSAICLEGDDENMHTDAQNAHCCIASNGDPV